MVSFVFQDALLDKNLLDLLWGAQSQTNDLNWFYRYVDKHVKPGGELRIGVFDALDGRPGGQLLYLMHVLGYLLSYN